MATAVQGATGLEYRQKVFAETDIGYHIVTTVALTCTRDHHHDTEQYRGDDSRNDFPNIHNGTWLVCYWRSV